MSNVNYPKEFDAIVQKAISVGKPVRAALAGADCENILQAMFDAAEDGFVKPILIGNRGRIFEMIEKLGFQDREYDIQPISDDTNPVQYAIEMIQAGHADILVRGNTQTRDFLLPILSKHNHLVEDKALVTHVVVTKIPDYERLLAISDVTLLVEPTIEQRKKEIKNMVQALKIYGVEDPAIALLALVEKPSFHMRNTVEAQGIVHDHKRKPIADCKLVGPIAYDLIVSEEAARLKGYDCEYSGHFDGIIVPNLLSGNLIVKVLDRNAGATSSGVLIGTKVPVAITSRSDPAVCTYLSLAACAVQANVEK